MKRDKSIAWRRLDAERLDFRELNVAIVGGTGGIGRAFSRFLASHGARVVAVGRTFRDADVPGIEFVEADLSLMRDAQRIAAQLRAETLDLLIFTTGIFAGPKREETADGIERDMAVSFLNRLVMLRELAPRLGKDRSNVRMKPRVFVIAYPGSGQTGNPDDLNAEASYGAMSQHMNTVAGNEALVLDAAKRYPHATFFGLNPGIIATSIRSNLLGEDTLRYRLVEGIIGLVSPSANTYAERIAPILVSPDIEGHSGAMFDRKGSAIQPSKGLTDSYVSHFIAASEELISRSNVHVAS